MNSAGRTVSLILVDPSGSVLGVLPPFGVTLPWWPEASEIVAAVRARHGVEVTVLRLLRTEPGRRSGGRVTYLASADRPVPDARPAGDVPELADHPLRAPWARPGGPEEILAWAAGRMAEIGRPVRGVVQQRSWNLSAIWRLDTTTGPTWLKVVPPFFAHEPAVLTWLAGAAGPGRTPVPLVAEPGRMIMDHVSGDDRYDADVAGRNAMVTALVRVQAAALGALGDLRAHGVPLLGPVEFRAAATDVVDRRGGEVSRRAAGEPPTAALTALAALVEGLDARFAAVAACGVPTTLVHGDFHSGNVRGDTILDWGDSVLGHPAFDLLCLTGALDAAGARAVAAVWGREWRSVVPGCDPDRALELLRPVADLRNAFMYVGFLDRIEPSEWPYHAQDVLPPLLAAAGLPGGPA